MAMNTSKIVLPLEVQSTIVEKAQNNSIIAQLSPTVPRIYNDVEYVWFSEDGEAEVVGEGAQKSSQDYEPEHKAGIIRKVQKTTRVTDEFQWADEDNQLLLMDQITDAQAKAIARSLDFMVLHAVNPLDMSALTGLTGLCDDGIQVASTGDAMDDIDAMAEAINETYNINGLAMSRKFANMLRAVRVPSTLGRYYDVPLNLQVGNIEGVPAAVSDTVNAPKISPATGVLALMGDFSLIKWAFIRNMWMEIITDGDPDGNGDLRRTNEIAVRTEAVYEFCVLVPEAFAVLKSSEAEPTSVKATAATASTKSSK